MTEEARSAANADPRPRYARLIGWLGGVLQDVGDALSTWSWGR
jgi:hypothetical protein